MVWLASRTVYRIRIEGLENLPRRGGALLVANHVSWLDGLLLLIVSSRPIRMVAHGRFTTGRLARWLAARMGVIPIWPEKTGSVRAALETAREALRSGELVCVFPEGGITRTGQLGRFKRGMLSMVVGTDAPIIPVYLDELWGSIFSYEGGRFFWKWPRRWPYPVSIYFGPAMRPDGEDAGRNAEQVRQAVQKLGTTALEKRMSEDFVPPRAFVRNCRANRASLQVADSLGEKLTGGQLLLRSLVLRRLLLREVLADDEQYVGILIPPSAGAVVVNAAMPLMGRVGVNLNYTLSKSEMDYCVQQCGIRHVLTTRRGDGQAGRGGRRRDWSTWMTFVPR